MERQLVDMVVAGMDAGWRGKTGMKLLCLFIIFLMLESVFAYPVLFQDAADSGSDAGADSGMPAGTGTDTGAGTDTGTPPETGTPLAEGTDSSASTLPSTAEPTLISSNETGSSADELYRSDKPCETSALTEKEAQNIKQLLQDGYVGREIGSDAPADTDRDTLEQNKVVITDPGRVLGEQKSEIGKDEKPPAAIIEQPNEKFEPWEMSHFLNNTIEGPFAYGLVIEDTLRAGRCKEWSDPDCALTGGNLKYRNSGAGIKADFVNVYKSFQNVWDGGESLTTFSEEENEILRAGFEQEDKENFDMKVAKRLESDLLENSIKTDLFEAKLATNCTSSSCVLSTYSMFDKYFNSWMSGEMTVSNFGPTVWFQMRKLFGWTGRRGILSSALEKQFDKLRQTFQSPGSWLSNKRMARMQTNIDKYGHRDFFNSLTNAGDSPDSPIALTSGFQSWWAKMSSPGADSYLDTIKSLERKRAFVEAVKDMRSFFRAGEANTQMAQTIYDNAARQFGENSPVAKQAYVDYGRQFARWLNQIDDSETRFDAVWWMTRNPFSQFYNYGVKPVGSGEVIDLYYDPRHMRRILDKFVDTGDWTGFESQRNLYQSAYETVKTSVGDDTGWLKLYKFDVAKADKAYSVHTSELDKFVGALHEDLWVNVPQRGWMQLNSGTADLVKASNMPEIELFRGGWTEAGALTPESLTGRITNARIRNNSKVINFNMDQMLGTLRERNWVSRRYWSALDKLMAQEDELMKSYFSIKGGIKWTTYPFGYWWVKKGFGIESISQYQLPDTWKELTAYTGEADVYNDAYVDFFANAGSDQGDIFIQVLNHLPWKYVLDKLSDNFNPAKGVYDMLTKNELRSEVEDLAIYSTTSETCEGCSLTLKSTGLEDFSPYFFVDKPIDNYILEDTRTDEAKKMGQTIVLFAHHTNLKGETSGDNTIEGGEINLASAKQDETTCSDALRKLFSEAPVGIPFYDIPPEAWERLGPAAGGLLGGMESISYGMFFWSGIFSSIAIQVLIAPKLQDCVDYEEGYYVHYFIPTREEEAKSGEDAAEISTKKVQNFVGDLKERFEAGFSGEDDTFTKRAVEGIGNEIDNFVSNAEDNDIVQATLTLQGNSSGQLTGRQLFYFWCGEGCEMHASEYKTQGKSVTKDSETGIGIEFDFAGDKLMRDGEAIVSTPDFTRMADVFNASGPFQAIPRRLTIACATPSEKTTLEINTRGDAVVLDPELEECIRAGVLAQTGLPLESTSLEQTFGAVNMIVSTTHPVIKPTGDSILAEGLPRRIAEGADSRLYLQADNVLRLSKSNDGINDVGKLKSIIFEHGSMVVKPNGCIIVWLRHHAAGVLEQNDAEALRTSLTESKNPETGCDEPALDFEVIGNEGSDFSQAKVENFNTSLERLGPFQVFETPENRYVLYSGPAPACEPFMRVIDKATGKFTDYAMNNIQPTPTGIKFTDADGTEHTLDFKSKDGVPMVAFDGDEDTLLNAQGRNGAFWYDPEKGLWYAENAQLLPLLEAFREGIATKVGPNGEVTSTASGNVLNLNVGDGSANLLDLPSLPEQPAALLLFIVSIVCAMAAIRVYMRGRIRA